MKLYTSEMYCCKCGKKGIPIMRKVGQNRKGGHLKKLYCPNCKEEWNHVEIIPFDTSYTYKHFCEEYENHNFDEKGNRIRVLRRRYV